MFAECPMFPSSYTVCILVISTITFLFYRRSNSRRLSPKTTTTTEAMSIMQPARTDLASPKNDPFTTTELAQYDGSDPSKPIYVAIKGALTLLSPLLSFNIGGISAR